MRRMGVMPEAEYYALIRKAKRKAAQVGAGSYKTVLRGMMQQYFDENPAFKT